LILRDARRGVFQERAQAFIPTKSSSALPPSCEISRLVRLAGERGGLESAVLESAAGYFFITA
jgi:hypothetical protein